MKKFLLGFIAATVFLNYQKLKKIMTDLTELKAAVQKDTDAENSAITLLKGLKDALDQAGTDPAALKAISDQLGSNADALAAAVVANTPADNSGDSTTNP